MICVGGGVRKQKLGIIKFEKLKRNIEIILRSGNHKSKEMFCQLVSRPSIF